MQRPATIDDFRKAKLFKGVLEPTMERLVEHASLIELQRGLRLFTSERGSRGYNKWVCCLLSGLFSTELEDADLEQPADHRVYLGLRPSGSTFGEVDAILAIYRRQFGDNETYSELNVTATTAVSIHALKTSQVLKIKHEPFVEAALEDVRLTMNLAMSMLEKTMAERLRALCVHTKGSEARILRTVLALSQLLGRDEKHPDKINGTFSLPDLDKYMGAGDRYAYRSIRSLPDYITYESGREGGQIRILRTDQDISNKLRRSMKIP